LIDDVELRSENNQCFSLEVRSDRRYVQQNSDLFNEGERPMAKATVSKAAHRDGKQRMAHSAEVPGQLSKPSHDAKTGQLRVGKARFEAVMQAAERSGLLSKKGSRISGRVSPALIEQAKRLTGIKTDTDLIEFALASVALEDKFADVFKDSRGKVNADLKLGF
jgi:hypothetical protein